MELHEFRQWIFQRQWSALREYARSKGVRIVGDLPIFVAYDSADVWARPDQFKLEPSGRPRVVAGVAMVHGLRDDHEARLEWTAILDRLGLRHWRS